MVFSAAPGVNEALASHWCRLPLLDITGINKLISVSNPRFALGESGFSDVLA